MWDIFRNRNKEDLLSSKSSFLKKYTYKWEMILWLHPYSWVLMGALYAPTTAYMRRNKHLQICFDFCNILPLSFILHDQNKTQSCERSTIMHWKNKSLFPKFIGAKNPLCTHGASYKQPENNVVSWFKKWLNQGSSSSFTLKTQDKQIEAGWRKSPLLVGVKQGYYAGFIPKCLRKSISQTT